MSAHLLSKRLRKRKGLPVEVDVPNSPMGGPEEFKKTDFIPPVASVILGGRLRRRIRGGKESPKIKVIRGRGDGLVSRKVCDHRDLRRSNRWVTERKDQDHFG